VPSLCHFVARLNSIPSREKNQACYGVFARILHPHGAQLGTEGTIQESEVHPPKRARATKAQPSNGARFAKIHSKFPPISP
jgi:hypothetical protein